MSEIRSELPQRLYRAEQVRELDRVAIEDENIPGIELMERAGQALFEVLRSYWSEAARVVVVCGGGNNGGDGYVLARLAVEAGLNCEVLAISDPEELRGDAKSAADKYLSRADVVTEYTDKLFEDADVIVDALLGTGLDREVDGKYEEVITTINSSNRPVLCADIPSGLNADNGCVMGVAVKATVTVSFIGLKQGLFTVQGPDCSDSILFSDLGVPEKIYSKVQSTAMRLDNLHIANSLSSRPRNSHKGDFGHVLLIGGDYGKTGAIRMAAEAAGRVGAGLISVATRPEHSLSIPLVRPELMTLAIENASDLSSLLENATVIAIGPGLGQSNWGQSLLSRVLETDLPLIIDADALNFLAKETTYSDKWVMTPHPGEAGRLLNKSTKQIQADRFVAAEELQQKYGGVIVLKGCGTIIADDENSYVCTAGNPGMASGGMGDVLTGVIAGLVAQGLDIKNAAKLGVLLHANAADAAAQDGERGMLATDLMPFLRSFANPK